MFTIIHTTHALRFRQWSRKAYAVFKSIGRHVTIGSIKNIIADAILGKQKNIFGARITLWRSRQHEFDEDPDVPPEEKVSLEIFFAPVFLQQNYYSRCADLPHHIVIDFWLRSFVRKVFSLFIFIKPVRFFFVPNDKCLRVYFFNQINF